MQEDFSRELAELQRVHEDLTNIKKTDSETIIDGLLFFEASAEGYESITDQFHIELIVPNNYPKILPYVRETSGKIDSAYEHVFTDGKLCLAVPVEERRFFLKQPSLLGFVNNLLIPFFFGYCCWKKDSKHPFGELKHGYKGITQYYLDILNLTDEMSVLAVVASVYERGYKRNCQCPCGSNRKALDCHDDVLHALGEQQPEYVFKYDFKLVLVACLEKMEVEQIQMPEPLQRQVLRILIKRVKMSGHFQRTILRILIKKSHLPCSSQRQLFRDLIKDL